MVFAPNDPRINRNGRPRDLARELGRLEMAAAEVRKLLTARQATACVLMDGRSAAEVINEQARMIADLTKQVTALYNGTLPTARDHAAEMSGADRDQALVAIGAFLDRAVGHGEAAS